MKDFSFRQAENNPGVITNLPTDSVAWSTCRNVRFKPGCLYKSPGRSAALATVINGLPVRAMFPLKGHDNVWRILACCDTKIYSFTNDFTVYSDITPGTSGIGCTVSYTVTNGVITAITGITGGGSGYTVGGQVFVSGGDGKATLTITTVSGGVITGLSIAYGGTGYSNGTGVATTAAAPPSSTSTDVWQFALIGGMPMLSNGVNTPWKWDLTGNPMTVVSGAPLICKAMHVHMNKLIVGNIQEGAYAVPSKLRWANTMQPNGGWITDLRGLSGGKDLVPHSTTMQGTDVIQAITSQGTKLIVFCERNIWYGSPAEWPLDYSWSAMDSNLGLIAPRAFVKTPKGLVYFMGQEDFHVMAEGIEDIGFPIRNSVFPNLNKAAIKTAFAYYKPSTREVYFCYATGTNAVPDTAAIYSEETKSFSFEDVDYLSHSFNFDSTNYQWDTIPFGSWDEIGDQRWDDMGKTGILPYEVVGTSSGQIQKADTGYNKSDGSPIEGYIETGDYILDNAMINKIIQELVPVLKPQDSVNAIMIQVGVRENLHKDIEWSLPQAFTIGVSRHVNFRKMGKYFRIRFFTDVTNSPYIIEGFSLKYSYGGSR